MLIILKHGEPMTKSEIKSIMEDADYNGDGKLDYSEVKIIIQFFKPVIGVKRVIDIHVV